MAPVFHDWLEFGRLVVTTMGKHPHTASALCATLFVAIWWVVTGGLGNEEQTWKRPHGRLFPSTSLVYDIYNGSMEVLSNKLSVQQLSFVVYYTPWSSDSRRLVPEFVIAAQHLKNEVVFIAINCWIGTCRGNYTFSSFPRLYGYHSKKPVEYLGPLERFDMVRFLRVLMRPFTVISHTSQLESFLSEHEVVVLAYFHWPVSVKSDPRYSVFFDVCLTSSNRVNSPAFGLITKDTVGRVIQMETYSDLQLRNPFNHTMTYPRNFNYTLNDIHGWIYQSVDKIVLELTPNATDLNYYRHQLKRGPAALLFLPSNPSKREKTLSWFREAAMKYHNCSCNTSRKQEEDSLSTSINSAKVDISAKSCMSRKEIGSSDALSCVYEVCQQCQHHCSTPYRVPYLLRHLDLSGMLVNTCHDVKLCRTLKLNDYYHKDMVDVCRMKRTAQRKGENGFLDFDIDQDFDDKRLNSILKKLNDFVAAALNQQPNAVYESLQQQLSVAKNQENGKLRTQKTNDSIQQTQRIERDATKEASCIYSMTPSFISQLVKEPLAHLPGLRCRTNRTINFFFLDSNRYFAIAKALGINLSRLVEPKTSLAIVDVKNEATYVFPEHLKIERHSLASFIVNFTLGTLRRRLRSSSPTSKQVCFRDGRGPYCFTEVSSQSFTEIIIKKEKDVLLLYSVPWCGHCRVADHVFLQSVNLLRSVNSLSFARIDTDQNDLPYEFTVDSFPKVVLFPRKRKNDSSHYPDELPYTLQNMINFLKTHSSRETQSSLRTLVRGIG